MVALISIFKTARHPLTLQEASASHGVRVYSLLLLLLTAPSYRDKAELTRTAGYVEMLLTYRNMVTHPSNNWARCRVSLLIKTHTLKLSYAIITVIRASSQADPTYKSTKETAKQFHTIQATTHIQ